MTRFIGEIENLREKIREKVCQIGLRAFATQSHIPIGQLRSIIDGRSVRADTLARASRALGLEFYIGPPRTIDNEPTAVAMDPDDADHVLVPQLPVMLAAGAGAAAPEDENPTHMIAFRREWMRKHSLTPGQVSAVEVMGDSMYPTFKDSDIVLVNHRRNSLKVGRVVAARINQNDLVIKRLQQTVAGDWHLQSDNPEYQTIEFAPNRHDHIIGTIVWRGRWL